METFLLSSLENGKLKSLIETSAVAMGKTYSPYSKFGVGAALECEDGSVITGCNVENVSFGLTVCAERTALCKAVSEGKRGFPTIAVSAVNKDFLVTPCGACRQFIAEFNPKMKIYLYNPVTGYVGATDLLYLLPDACVPGNMKPTFKLNKDFV